MITLEVDSPEFQKNSNQTGLQRFNLIKSGTNPDGKNVYIYKRTYIGDNRVDRTFGFEVFIPLVKKAGTYQLPNNKSITYNEDFEEYPGASHFGRSAFFCVDIQSAEDRFNSLMRNEIVPDPNSEVDDNQSESKLDVDIELETEIIDSNETAEPKKVSIETLEIPMGEFCVKDVAAKNSVSYQLAYLFVRDVEKQGGIRKTKKERHASRGKPTQLFVKV